MDETWTYTRVIDELLKFYATLSDRPEYIELNCSPEVAVEISNCMPHVTGSDILTALGPVKLRPHPKLERGEETLTALFKD